MLFDFELHQYRYKNSSLNVSMFKYILFIIVLINSFSSIFFEKFIIKFIVKFWNKNNIKKYKNDINKITENKLNGINEEQPLFKYQEIYFYERRLGNYKGNKGILNKKVNGKNFIELVGANDNANDNTDINNINDISEKETNIDNK